ncbi:MAG: hypothetical protein ABJA81_02160 [Nocardioidaceae bacterium]
MSFDLASGASSTEDELTATPCATDIELFLNPLLEDPPVRSNASNETWRDYEALVVTARGLLLVPPKERIAIRKLTGVKIESEDLDEFTGSRGSRQPVNHGDVIRIRAQHPEESLEAIPAGSGARCRRSRGTCGCAQ